MTSQPNESTLTTTSIETTSPTISDKELMKINFYRTYDVMTGIRIAATLGGFFALMVLLVVYKSKSKTEKALEDPTLAAAAVAEVEEEERQLAAVLEATAYQQLNPRRARRSLDTSSVSPGWIRSTTRFSSIAGYSSLMEPPTRTHSRLPCFVDEDSPSESDKFSCEDISVFYNRYLDVPRRSSNITCSSSGSSYLERRDSSVVLGLPALPAHATSRSRRRQSSPLPEHYDFYYPIDIRVIQPTPSTSPCGSERALYDDVPRVKPRLAPLASISSCNSSLATDCPDLELQSFASDSVFHEEGCEDTDVEGEPFSTDSEDENEEERGACYRRDSRRSRPTFCVHRLPQMLPKPTPSTSAQEDSELQGFDFGARTPLSAPLDEKSSWSQETLF